MRTLITGLALAVFSSAALAQVPALHNAEIEDRTSINNPARAVQETGNGWVAMEIPAIEGTRSPCCWQGNWTSQRQIGCSLEKNFHSYGSMSQSPLEERLVVYARAEKGETSRLKITGAQCPMDAGGQTVTWIGGTDDDKTLNWLVSLAGIDSERISNSALWALALHAGDGAGGKLTGIAENSDDPEQRGMAMFWLAHERPEEAKEFLLQAVQSESDEEVLEQAVFALSQLPPQSGGPMLLELAGNSDIDRHVRRQALFWLVQSGDDETIAQLTELLTR